MGGRLPGTRWLKSEWVPKKWFKIEYLIPPSLQLLNKQSSNPWFEMQWRLSDITIMHGVIIMCVFFAQKSSLIRTGGNRFFVIREIEAFHVWKRDRPKIDVNSWFAIPVVIVKFSFFAREFVKNAIFNREVAMLTLFFVISFSWPLPGNMY